MKRKKFTLPALCFALSFLAVPAIQAGDYGAHPNRAPSSASYKNSLHIPLHGHLQRAPSPRCQRRTARLMQMIQKRRCLSQAVSHVNQPVRAHSYLSNHYPPYRYGW